MGIETLTGADLAKSKIRQHGYLPIAAAYCRSLDLVNLINGMVPSKMELSPGLAVQAMVLDTLSGRTPLYRLKEFIEGQDTELLLGQKAKPELFEDTNIGRSLDLIFKAGSSKILTKLGANAIKQHRLNASVVSYDTTSTSLWGTYATASEDSDAPNITYGYSKDHRPDLKQFMTELLCVERGIPIFADTLDGNSSDKKSNNEMLSNISAVMAKNGLGEGAFVYVADSAMINEENLKSLGGNSFISRLPANYKECSVAINKAVEANQWESFGALAETPSSKKRPSAIYKGFETTVMLYNAEYRAIVVHSSDHDIRRQKRIERELKKSEADIAKQVKGMVVAFSCEEDATVAAKLMGKIKSRFHCLETTIEKSSKQKSGRPPKNKEAAMKTVFTLSSSVSCNESAIEKLKKEAGCFVLIANKANKEKGALGLSKKEILITYKGQNGVERNFAFLKDPLIVNDIFLKKPSRIDVLGMVLVIALIIWRLMERSMRAHIENTGEDLPGLNRQRTKRPTSFMLSVLIRNIQTIVTEPGCRYFIKEPDPTTLAFLKALGLTKEIFLIPGTKCRPIIPRNLC